MFSSCVGINGSGSILSPSEGRAVLTFPSLSPDIIFHWDNVARFFLDGISVSTRFSNFTWNLGETNPVYRFNIKATDYA